MTGKCPLLWAAVAHVQRSIDVLTRVGRRVVASLVAIRKKGMQESGCERSEGIRKVGLTPATLHAPALSVLEGAERGAVKSHEGTHAHRQGTASSLLEPSEPPDATHSERHGLSPGSRTSIARLDLSPLVIVDTTGHCGSKSVTRPTSACDPPRTPRRGGSATAWRPATVEAACPPTQAGGPRPSRCPRRRSARPAR